MFKKMDILWVVVILIVGFMWLRSHDEAIKANALAAERKAELAKRQESLDSLIKSIQLQDEKDEAEKASLSKQIQSLAKVQDSVQLETDKLLGSVLKSVEDTIVKRKVEEVAQHYEHQLKLKDVKIAFVERQYEISQGQLSRYRDTILPGIQKLNKSLSEEIETLNKQKNPSELRKAGELLLAFTLGYAAGK